MTIKKILHNDFDSAIFFSGFSFQKKCVYIFFRLILIIILTSFDVSSQPPKFDVRPYYESNKSKNISDFFKDFPYEKYLESNGIENFQQLEKDRYFFWQKFKDGDPFLYNLEDYYVIKYPVKTLDDAKNRLSLAEKYLEPNRKFEPIEDRINPIHEKINEIYLVIGHFLMASSARWLGEEIKRGNLDADSPEIKSLIDRMKTKKVLVEIPETLAQKISSRPPEQTIARAKSFIEENRIYLLAVIAVVALICVIFLTTRKLVKTMVVLLLFCIAALVYVGIMQPENMERAVVDNNPGTNSSNVKTENKSSDKNVSLPTHCKIEEHKQFSNYDIGSKSDVEFSTVINKDNSKEIGQLMKMNIQKVKVAYFIKQTSGLVIEQWLKKLQENAQVILVTSGGYSNALDQPEGLTFENGSLINAVLLHDRKALVKIKNGEMNVDNLKNLNSTTKVKYQPSDKIEDSFVSLAVYFKLVSSLQEEKMTSFQTHLLAYQDELKINPEKAADKLAERRLLALVKSKNGDRYHIIFNINTQQKLGVLSEDIFNFLKNQGYEIETLLNLDTGKYDILEIFNRFGEIFKVDNEKVIAGTKELNIATNLLVYYIEK